MTFADSVRAARIAIGATIMGKRASDLNDFDAALQRIEAAIAEVERITALIGALSHHDDTQPTTPGTAPALAGVLTEKAQTQLATAEHIAKLHAELVDAHELLVNAHAAAVQVQDQA